MITLIKSDFFTLMFVTLNACNYDHPKLHANNAVEKDDNQLWILKLPDDKQISRILLTRPRAIIKKTYLLSRHGLHLQGYIEKSFFF